MIAEYDGQDAPVRLLLANDAVRRGGLDEKERHPVAVDGRVEPRTCKLILPSPLCDHLGLRPRWKLPVRTADGRLVDRDVVGFVRLRMLGREGTFTAVADPDAAQPLIGRVVLDTLELEVDPVTGTCRPLPPERMVVEL